MNLNSPLVSSAHVHLTDKTLPKKINLVVAAPSFSLLSAFHSELVNKLKATEERFSVSRSKIRVGGRTCEFVLDIPKVLLGTAVDYLFLSDAKLMRSDFLSFVDDHIRPYAIVIQTEDTSSIYSQEIPHK